MMNILHRRKPGAVLPGPVAHQQLLRQADHELAGHLARLVQVAQLDANAAGALQPEQTQRIVLMNQRQGGVVLKMSRIEKADHRHLLEPRHHTRWRHLPTGHDEGHRIAGAHAHGAAKLGAEHDAKLPGLELLQQGLLLGRHIADLALERRIDPPDHGPLHVLAAADQGLRSHKGRSPDHLGVTAQLGQRGGQVGDRAAPGAIDLDVRNHAQHAIAHLLLKTVHHAQHDDERGHAQGNAQHGDGRDEGDESVAARRTTGAGVAPAQGQLVGNGHGAIVASPRAPAASRGKAGEFGTMRHVQRFFGPVCPRPGASRRGRSSDRALGGLRQPTVVARPAELAAAAHREPARALAGHASR
jgi:hypothetical protein